MSLKLTQSQIDQIRKHAERTYPFECCGFLLGSISKGDKDVVEVWLANNERTDSAHNRYLIAPEVYQKVEREAESRGLDILGFYHSHPDHPARPSEYDRSHALPWWSYIIVAVAQGESKEVTSWVLGDQDRKFYPEPIQQAEGQEV